MFIQVLGNDAIQITPDGTLEIEHSKLTHEGQYKCTASNIAGKDERVTRVVVQMPPFITPATITEYTVTENSPITMQCVATGSPTPEIQWFRKGIKIDAGQPGILYLFLVSLFSPTPSSGMLRTWLGSWRQ